MDGRGLVTHVFSAIYLGDNSTSQMPAISFDSGKRRNFSVPLAIYLAWTKQLAPKKRWWPGWKMRFPCGAGTVFRYITTLSFRQLLFLIHTIYVWYIYHCLPTWMVDFMGNIASHTKHGCYGSWKLETQRFFFYELSPSNDLTKIQRANTWELQMCSVSLIQQLGPENYAIPTILFSPNKKAFHSFPPLETSKESWHESCLDQIRCFVSMWGADGKDSRQTMLACYDLTM